MSVLTLREKLENNHKVHQGAPTLDLLFQTSSQYYTILFTHVGFDANILDAVNAAHSVGNDLAFKEFPDHYDLRYCSSKLDEPENFFIDGYLLNGKTVDNLHIILGHFLGYKGHRMEEEACGVKYAEVIGMGGAAPRKMLLEIDPKTIKPFKLVDENLLYTSEEITFPNRQSLEYFHDAAYKLNYSYAGVKPKNTPKAQMSSNNTQLPIFFKNNNDRSHLLVDPKVDRQKFYSETIIPAFITARLELAYEKPTLEFKIREVLDLSVGEIALNQKQLNAVSEARALLQKGCPLEKIASAVSCESAIKQRLQHATEILGNIR